jgi:hypothetical protein|tara:strand:+ start:695 stop:991 length:297 start_codon:yes stop_codon:yes gene_type:complete
MVNIEDYKPQTHESMTEWATLAKPGECIIYYKGFLGEDVTKDFKLRKFANFVLEMEKQHVNLFQQKVSGRLEITDKDDIVYLYIAQKKGAKNGKYKVS